MKHVRGRDSCLSASDIRGEKLIKAYLQTMKVFTFSGGGEGDYLPFGMDTAICS
jgi:hypothetical protein